MKKPASISSRSPSGERTTTSPQSDRQWTFLTKHAAVQPHFARHPDETMRSMEALLNVLEREEIDRRVRQGYRAESETGESAQLVKPKRLSIMWLPISIVTLVGWIPHLGYQLLLKREA